MLKPNEQRKHKLIDTLKQVCQDLYRFVWILGQRELGGSRDIAACMLHNIELRSYVTTD